MRKLIIMSLFIMVISCQNCNKSISFTSQPYTCFYDVDYQTSACTNPIFIACTVYSNSNNTYYSKEICFKYCCKQQNIVCQLQVDQQNSSVSQTHVIIIVVLIISIGFIIVCSFKYSDNLQCLYQKICCCFKRSATINTQNSRENETQINIEPNVVRQWKMSSSIKEIQCSVCLGDEVNLILDCGHFFHKACILQCFKRKFECILCRSNNFDCFLLYCENCLQSYTEVYPPLIRIFQNVKVKCENCLREPSLSKTTNFIYL